jgi:hypothetical protein
LRSVDRLARYYESNPYNCWDLVKKHDYIKSPKPDGYRSIHLIYKYQGEHQEGAYKGLRIEIQLRSELQHAWATAVETIDSFTSQSLKSNIGSDAWKRFFALMGSVVAAVEDRPMVPDAPMNTETAEELHRLCKQLMVPDVFSGLKSGVELMGPNIIAAGGYYILTLDSKNRQTIRSKRYATSKEADEAYLALEKKTKDQPHEQVVLVASSSVRRLREAYPNYFADMGQFIGICNNFRDKVERDDERPKEGETPRGDA